MFGAQITTSLASAGVFVAAIAIGTHLSSYALSRGLKNPPLTLLGPLAISFGFLAVTPILLLAAVLGIYSPPVFGLIGWIVTGFIRFRLPRNAGRRLREPVSLGLLLVAVSAALLAFFTAGEHLYGGRDQGFYTNIAIWMAHNGKTVVDVPLGLKDQELLRALGPGILGSGLYFDHGHIVSQFSHAYPAWLAQAFAVGGHVGIDVMNAFLAGTCVLLFFAVARSLMRSGPALIATAFLAFSPAQIWISRITLSELLAQQAFLSMSILLVWAVRLKCPRLILARTASDFD